MGTLSHLDRRQKLMDVIGCLSSVASSDDLIEVLRSHARSVAGSDGITVVRREGDQVAYIAEDAVDTLWTGHSFPIRACISGIAMLENQPVIIPDIYADERVPHAAYEPTFVKSMAMFPIGQNNPTLAIGIYWNKAREMEASTLSMLSSLAHAATAAFERIRRVEETMPLKSRFG